MARHKHQHVHDHGTSNIRMAFFLNVGFCVLEIAGGILTNSIAIISDALHDLGDSFSLAMAWYFQKLSTKKSSPQFSYGYKRFSVLGALINSLVLLTGSGFVIYASVGRILAPQQADAKGMLILALLGIVFNGLAILRLKTGKSLNERAVALHLLEDVLGWAAVLVAGTVMLFADIPVLDPLLSLLITCYILFNIYRNLKDALKVLLQGTPEDIDEDDVRASILSVEGVKELHDLHTWTMDGQYNILTAHIVIDPATGQAGIKSLVKEKLRALGIDHPTIEVEYSGESCSLDNGCG